MILQDLPTLKCSEQTSVPAAIVYSLPSSQRIPWIHYFPIDADVGQFLSLLLVFKNTKTSRHSEKNRLDRPRSKTFQGKHCQNKTPSLTSLTFMQLVPGDDRVVRHICVRCIVYVKDLTLHVYTLRTYDFASASPNGCE